MCAKPNAKQLTSQLDRLQQEKKRLRQKLQRAERRLELVLEYSRAAWWELDVESGEVVASAMRAKLLGYRSGQDHFFYRDLATSIHPDDRERAGEALEALLAGETERYDVEYRLRGAYGEWKWFRDVGEVTSWNQHGRPREVSGLVIDIGAQKELERKLEETVAEYTQLFDGMADTTFVMNSDGELLAANRAALERLGYTRDELLSLSLEDIEAPEYAERIDERLQEALEQGEVLFETAHLTRDGTEVPVEVTASAVSFRGQRAILGIARDISERKQTESTLHKERYQLQRLHEAVERFQACSTEDELCQAAAEAAESIIGFDLCILYCLDDGELVPMGVTGEVPKEDIDSFQLGEGLAGKSLETGEVTWGTDVREFEDARPESPKLRAFMSVPVGDVGVFQAASYREDEYSETDVRMAKILAGHLLEEVKRIRVEKELTEQAIRDPLTGLYNRRYLNEVLVKERHRSERYDYPLTFMMVDVDRFKEINDTHSHQVGDRVLIQVAELLKRNLRSADLIVRYGGDEFLAVMPHTATNPKHIRERVHRAVEDWNKGSSLLGFPLSLSIGFSSWHPRKTPGLEAALKEADRAMYEDKLNT